MPKQATKEPPRPEWDAGGPAVEAALAQFDALGFDPETGSELITSASRICAELLAETAGTGRERVVALMKATVRLASQAVHGAHDAAARHHLDVLEPACSAGCASCCHLHVSISVPEALVLAAFLRDTRSQAELTALRARVASNVERLRGLDQEKRVGANVPCPILDVETGRCTAYVARPLVCAAANSLDASACKRAIVEPDVELPIESLQLGAIRAVQAGLAVALRAHGLDVRRYELSHALAIALEHDDAADRYLRGERLFEAAATPGDASRARLEKTCDGFVRRDGHLRRASALR